MMLPDAAAAPIDLAALQQHLQQQRQQRQQALSRLVDARIFNTYPSC